MNNFPAQAKKLQRDTMYHDFRFARLVFWLRKRDIDRDRARYLDQCSAKDSKELESEFRLLPLQASKTHSHLQYNIQKIGHATLAVSAGSDESTAGFRPSKLINSWHAVDFDQLDCPEHPSCQREESTISSYRLGFWHRGIEKTYPSFERLLGREPIINRPDSEVWRYEYDQHYGNAEW
jgi:hypothetical protein